MNSTVSDMQRPAWFGPFMMVCANICFSLSGILCRFIPWSALTTNGIRDLLGSLVLGLYILKTHHKLKFNLTVFFGSVCMCGVTTLFIMAMKLTTAANTVVLQFTAPIWIMLFSLLLFHRKPARADLLTLLFVGIGIICFFIDGLSSKGMLGNLIAIAAGLCYAGLFLLNSFPNGDRLSSLFFGQLGAGLLMGPLVFTETEFTAPCIISVVILGLIQVGLGYVFFNLGTGYTSPVAASLISAIEPILNPLLVAVFLQEFVSPLCLAGAAIVVVSILLYNIYGTDAEQTS